MFFQRPVLLLLLIPFLLAWWRTRSSSRPVAALRLLLIVLGIIALAQPTAKFGARGRDLIILVDRSRSMPAGTEERALEIVRLAQLEARPGDRVGVVGFGARAALEHLPADESLPFGSFDAPVNDDGTDIAAAIRTGLTLIPQDRPGTLLLLSDGENTGRDPDSAARRAFARQVPIHVLVEKREQGPDLSIARIDLPREVAIGEPFQFSLWVHADRRCEAEFELKRGSQTLSRGERIFEAGLNRVLLRDLLGEPGIATYSVHLEHAPDSRPQNDHARAALRVRGERRLLILNHEGNTSPLVEALRAAALEVDVMRPEDIVLDAIGLSRWRAVGIENVSAMRIGETDLAPLSWTPS